MRRTTNAGIEFIKRMEGVETRVYLDAVKKPTVGVGHLVLPSDGLHVGEVISMERVDKLLRADLADAEYAVNRLVTVPLTDDQFDALVSFVFNVGGDAFSRSTLLRKLNAGDYDGAAAHFADWNKAGGRPIKGLTRRRRAEADLFEGGDSAPETAKADEPIDEPTAEVPTSATGTEITGAVPTDQSTVVTTTTTTGPVPDPAPQTVVNVASTPTPQAIEGGAKDDPAVLANQDSLITKIQFWATRATTMGGTAGAVVATLTGTITAVSGLSAQAQLIVVGCGVGLIVLIAVAAGLYFIVGAVIAAIDHAQTKATRADVSKINVK